MTEDNFEDFLKKAAQSYNAPPARTPRDDMWNAIQAKRAAGPRVVYGGGSATRESSVRRFGSKIWLGAAAAAVLFLATGVGIGRWTAASSNPPTVATVVPTTTVQTPAATTETGQPTNVAAPEARSVASGPAVRGGSQPSYSSGLIRSQVEQPAGVNGGERSRVAIDRSPNSSGSSSAYQLTAVRHLSEAEALLTSFRTHGAADQQMDAQLGSWARELLSNTRLLLDSPVANDPQRRPLLEDLELVLVQIVQLSPGSTPQDREMIENTLRQDQVMTRLRTAIPAGSQRGS